MDILPLILTAAVFGGLFGCLWLIVRVCTGRMRL